MVRHAQMKIDVKLIRKNYCRYGVDILHVISCIHKYIYLIQSIYMGVVTHTWAFQK